MKRWQQVVLDLLERLDGLLDDLSRGRGWGCLHVGPLIHFLSCPWEHGQPCYCYTRREALKAVLLGGRIYTREHNDGYRSDGDQ